MKKWLSGIRGTVVTIALWTVGWGLGFGGIAELVDSSGRVEDIWPMVMAVVGIVGGVILSGLLRIRDSRSLDEIPHVRFTTLGAVTGLIVGVLSGVTGFPGDYSHPGIMIGTATALGAVTGFGSAVFFRLIAKQTPIAPPRTTIEVR